MKTGLVSLGALVAFLIAGALGYLLNEALSPEPPYVSSMPYVPPASNVPSHAPARLPGTIPGEGNFVVGTDVQPGTYKSLGPTRDMPCIVQFFRDFNRSATESPVMSHGQTVIEISDKYKLITVAGCSAFSKIG